MATCPDVTCARRNLCRMSAGENLQPNTRAYVRNHVGFGCKLSPFLVPARLKSHSQNSKFTTSRRRNMLHHQQHTRCVELLQARRGEHWAQQKPFCCQHGRGGPEQLLKLEQSREKQQRALQPAAAVSSPFFLTVLMKERRSATSTKRKQLFFCDASSKSKDQDSQQRRQSGWLTRVHHFPIDCDVCWLACKNCTFSADGILIGPGELFWPSHGDDLLTSPLLEHPGNILLGEVADISSNNNSQRSLCRQTSRCFLCAIDNISSTTKGYFIDFRCNCIFDIKSIQ